MKAPRRSLRDKTRRSRRFVFVRFVVKRRYSTIVGCGTTLMKGVKVALRPN